MSSRRTINSTSNGRSGNFRGSELPKADDLVATWKFIEEGVNKILAQDLTDGISTTMYMNIYTAIHNFCVSHNHQLISTRYAPNTRTGAQLLGEDLYKNLENYLQKHLTDLCNECLKYNDDSLIQFYTGSWDRFTTGARYLNHIFDYVNRHWVKREREDGRLNVYDINTLCLIRWKKHLFDSIQPRLVPSLLNMIQRQRNGEDIQSSSLKQVIQSFVSLGLDETNTKRTNLVVYQECFETAFLNDTKDYYTNESKEFLTHHSVVEYIKKADTRLNEEYQRVKMYLHPLTEERLMRTCEEVLVSEHSKIIQDEFQVLLLEDRQEDFSRMYSLLIRVKDGLVPIQESFQNHIKKQGMEAVQKLLPSDGPIDPKAYVDSLLSIHGKYSEIVNKSFENNTDLVKAFDNGCRDFINNNIIAKPSQQLEKDSRTPELLAKYADSLLKKSSKNATGEADIDSCLNGIMRIFQYLDEKDAFEKFYSRLLSKRLINGSSISEDAEGSMVGKLKELCGYEYTNKLQRMFQDMKTSEDMQSRFKLTLEKRDVDFTANILTQGTWPLPDTKLTFDLPHQLQGTFERFQNFYGTQHSGRKLMWLWSFCKGEVKANYPKTSKTGYTFQLSIFQIAILLPFNTKDDYTFQQLREITGLSKEYLSNSLHFLIKAKVLLQTPESNDIGNESNIFSYCDTFKSKKVRVNLNLPLKTEQKQDTEDTQKKIQEDRTLFLQAIIVRIMKARKELTHVNLVQETLEQSKRFKPRVPDIKKTIDTLIEREYLERVVKPNNTTTYQYLA